MQKAKNPKGGFITTTELILVFTALVLGLIVGMVSLRNAVTAELEDLAEAIGNIDQFYQYSGLIEKTDGGSDASAQVSGSQFAFDNPDESLGDDSFINKVLSWGGDSAQADN